MMASKLYLRSHLLVQRVRGVWSGYKRRRAGHRVEELTHVFISWTYWSAPFPYTRTVMCELRLLYIMWTLYKLKYVLSTLGKLFRGVLGWGLLYCWKLIPRVSISEHRNLGPLCLLLDSWLCRSSILGTQPYTNTNWFLHLKGCSSLGRF